MMDFTGLTLLKLSNSTTIKSFDCGDSDLNSFLLSKAIHYKNELLATTYLLENESRTIAFFSIFNDSVKTQDIDFASKSAVRRFISENVSSEKRHLKYFPAIKIGRLAVCQNNQRGGLGKAIMQYIISLAISQNENCACKFISVDAYAKSTGFYEKLGFQYFSPKDEGGDRQMFLDLSPYINALESE